MGPPSYRPVYSSLWLLLAFTLSSRVLIGSSGLSCEVASVFNVFVLSRFDTVFLQHWLADTGLWACRWFSRPRPFQVLEYPENLLQERSKIPGVLWTAVLSVPGVALKNNLGLGGFGFCCHGATIRKNMGKCYPCCGTHRMHFHWKSTVHFCMVLNLSLNLQKMKHL